MVRVESLTDDYEIVFEGLRGQGWQGDISMDDISLTPGCQLCLDCKLAGLFCSFFLNGTVGLVAINTVSLLQRLSEGDSSTD